MPRGQISSCLKACKMIDKGCLYNVVRVKDLECETPSIETVPIVREFLQFFLMTFLEFLLNGKLTLAWTYYQIQIPFQFLHIGWNRLN